MANSRDNPFIHLLVIKIYFPFNCGSGNYAKMWKSLQIFFSYLTENFTFNFNFLGNARNLPKRSDFCRKLQWLLVANIHLTLKWKVGIIEIYQICDFVATHSHYMWVWRVNVCFEILKYFKNRTFMGSGSS